MSSAIVILPLKSWAQSHISAILQATTKSAFDSAFDAFLAKDVKVTLNGKAISRDAYKVELSREKFDEEGAQVTFGGVVQVPKDQDKPVEAGVVGLFYNAIIGESIVVRDAPVERAISSSVNLVIDQDKSITPPHLPSGVRGGGFDARRVFALNQVILDGPVPTDE